MFRTIRIYPEWNVKNKIIFIVIRIAIIRIYPEWNVKISTYFHLNITDCIRIYPEWNVKRDYVVTTYIGVKLEYIQNGM